MTTTSRREFFGVAAPAEWNISPRTITIAACVFIGGAILIAACVAGVRLVARYVAAPASAPVSTDELTFDKTSYATLPNGRLLASSHNFEFSFELAVKPGTTGLVFLYGEPALAADPNRPYVKLSIAWDGTLVARVHRTLGELTLSSRTAINDGVTRHIRFCRIHTRSAAAAKKVANKWTLSIDEDVVAEHHDKLRISEVIPASGIYVGGAEFVKTSGEPGDHWPFSGIEGVIGKVSFNGERIKTWRIVNAASNKTCCPCPKAAAATLAAPAW
jgi:Laminin G domain